MDVLESGTGQVTQARRCHLWCWAPSTQPPEWERRSFVLGGLSFTGLLTAAVSAAISENGNRHRRDAAIRNALPQWRYVASGNGRLVDGRLVITETSGVVRTFDPGNALSLDGPAPGWIRVQPAGSPTPWAIQVM
jgi:hypothetical protein